MGWLLVRIEDRAAALADDNAADGDVVLTVGRQLRVA